MDYRLVAGVEIPTNGFSGRSQAIGKAIAKGDIIWNGVPYTVESEAMNLDLFETCLSLTQKLDKNMASTLLLPR